MGADVLRTQPVFTGLTQLRPPWANQPPLSIAWSLGLCQWKEGSRNPGVKGGDLGNGPSNVARVGGQHPWVQTRLSLCNSRVLPTPAPPCNTCLHPVPCQPLQKGSDEGGPSPPTPPLLCTQPLRRQSSVMKDDENPTPNSKHAEALQDPRPHTARNAGKT